tara:strand:+ start:1554 stop:2306 length:753 start_codon:yes stop_codon:yes gene_type:complete
MKYCFDIDGTLCHTPSNPDGHGMRYGDATPFPWMVKLVNRLYDEGHYIIMMTARGRGSGINHSDLTRNQLAMWGYKYHELEPMFHKPTADIFIDDKGINVNEWLKQQQIPQTKGIIAGAFDVIHPGYIRMFADAKQHCNHLTVALHEDPSMARPHKLKPVQTVEERKEILKAIKYVDDVVVYQAEDTFLSYLNDYDIRFLGTDYKDGTYSGKELDIDIVWLDRENHNYSSTKLKTDIFKSILPRATGNYD